MKTGRKAETRIRVIGVGNPLCGDDGAGVRVVERLRAGGSGGAEWIDGGTEGLGLLCWFEGVDRIILVDAVRMGAAPGTVRVLDPARLRSLRPAREHVSSHWTDILEVIDAAGRLGFRPRIDIVGIEPRLVAAGTELSEPAARGVDAAVRRIREMIKEDAADTTSSGSEPNGQAEDSDH